MGPGACSDISVSLVTCTLGRLGSEERPEVTGAPPSPPPPLQALGAPTHAGGPPSPGCAYPQPAAGVPAMPACTSSGSHPPGPAAGSLAGSSSPGPGTRAQPRPGPRQGAAVSPPCRSGGLGVGEVRERRPLADPAFTHQTGGPPAGQLCLSVPTGTQEATEAQGRGGALREGGLHGGAGAGAGWGETERHPHPNPLGRPVGVEKAPKTEPTDIPEAELPPPAQPSV